MGFTLKRVANREWGVLGGRQSIGRGKLGANITPCVADHLGMVFERSRKRRSSNWLQKGCLTCPTAPVLKLGIHPEIERPAILNRSMPSTAGATIGIPPVDEADLSVRQLMQFTALDRSIPDGERFSQEHFYQCS